MRLFSPRIKSILALILTLILLLCSWVGLGIYRPESNTLFNLPEKLLRTIKATMGNDPAAASFPGKDLPWQLVVAKVLASVVLLVGLFKVVEQVFFEHYTQIRLLLKRRPTLIVGMGDKGSFLLKDLKDSYRETGVVIERSREHPNVRQIRRNGHLVVFGNAASADVLRDAGIDKARQLICFFNDERTSLDILQTLHTIAPGRPTHDPLHCHLHLGNTRLTQLLQSAWCHSDAKKGLHLHFFNLQQMLARQFFHRFPHWYHRELATGSTAFHLCFLGWDATTRALVYQTLQVLHLQAPGTVRLLVGAADPDLAEQDFLQSYPGAATILPLRFFPYRGGYRDFLQQHMPEDAASCAQLLILGTDEDGGLATALDILHATPAHNFILYVRSDHNRRPDSLLRQWQHPRLRLYGSLQSLCTMEMITLARQDRLARAVHEDYLRQLGEKSASESSAYQTPWEELPEDAKDANRAQADHLPFKLAQLGCLDNLRQPREITLSPDAVEALAHSEHERWMAQRILAGWSYAPERDNLRRLHPSLVSWERLSDAERQKDRDTILRIPLLLQALHSREHMSEGHT